MLVDVVAIDKYNDGKKTHTKVLVGEPSILKKAEHAKRPCSYVIPTIGVYVNGGLEHLEKLYFM